ncbi:MAG: L-threonine 3-dehydrogenase [Candidatus Edwardsbacteria bacterium]
MKAIVKTKRDFGVELKEVEIPQIKEDEVLVKVKATSICGTDVHIYEWNEWAQERIKRIPQILGHEFAGEVVEIGKNVTKIKIGDYISAETHIPCGYCVQCLSGQQHICHNLKILGVDTDGCFAEYAAIPEVVAWKNDKSIPWEFASVQEPLGNAVYCTLVEPVAGKTVLIFGDGPTALFATGVAAISGASYVILAGMEPVRLEMAKKMGADKVMNVTKEDVEKIIFELTDGIGVDVVLEMAGAQKAIEQGLKVVRKGGRFCAFGLPPGNITIDINNGIVFKGLTLYGINGRLMFDTWIKVTNLLKYKKIDISPIITHKLPLEKFEEGFSLMMKSPKTSGKVVLLPEMK